MRSRFHALIVFVLAVLSASASGQQWHEGRSANFRVVTDAGDRDARDTLLRLEQARGAFGQLLRRGKLNQPNDATVIQVRAEATLRQAVPAFSVPLTSGAISANGVERWWEIARNPEGASAVVGDLGLMLLQHNYPRTPGWFDAGFRDYFSSIRTGSDSVEFGAKPAQVSAANWIPVSQVLAAREVDAASRFQCWVLVHWIFTNSRLPDAAKYFDLTMNRGVSIDTALRQAFGISSEDLDKELRQYAQTAGQKPQKYPLSISSDVLTFNVKKIRPTDAQAMLANAALDIPSVDRGALIRQLTAIMQAAPDNVRAHRALAYGHILQKDTGNALEHVRRAIQLDDSDATMQYWYAVALNAGEQDRMGTESSDVKFGTAINAAFRMNPDLAAAHEFYGLALLASDKPEAAQKELGRAAALRPRNERYLFNLGRALDANGNRENAMAIFEMLKNSSDPEVASAATSALTSASQSAKQHSRWDEMGISASTYKDPTDPRWKPKAGAKKPDESDGESKEEFKPDTRKTEYMKGTLASVVCSDDPGAVLLFSSGGRQWKLYVADRKNVLLIGPDNFSCAWRNQRASVNYKVRKGTEADVVSLTIE